MLIPASQIIGKPIYAQDGSKVGEINDIVFDPAWFVIIGFVTQPAKEPAQTKLVPVEQLVELTQNQLKVLTKESIVTMDKFKDRVTMMLKNQQAFSLTIKTDSGKELGKLKDLSLNPVTLRLESLTVSDGSTQTMVKLPDVTNLEHQQFSLILTIKPDQTEVKKQTPQSSGSSTVHEQMQKQQKQHKQEKKQGLQKVVKKVESTVQNAVKDVKSMVKSEPSTKSEAQKSSQQPSSKPAQETPKSHQPQTQSSNQPPQKIEIHTDSVTIFDQSPSDPSTKSKSS